MLDEPKIKELYGDITANSVTQATDYAEKLLIKDGVPFDSFEITKVYEVLQKKKKVTPSKIGIKCWNCGAVFTRRVNRIGIHKHKCSTCDLFGFIEIQKQQPTCYIFYSKKHVLKGGSNKKGKSKIRIAQLSCDWKDEISEHEVDAALKNCGPNANLYFYYQDEVDSKVMFVSSITLTQSQLDALWKAGDLATGDVDFWEGDNFDDIIEQLKKHIENEASQ